MNKKEFKVLIVIMGLLLSFCLIFYFVYSFFVSDKSFDANIILDGNKFFKYKNNSYENLISMEAIGKSEFKIYSSNTYILTIKKRGFLLSISK